MPAHPPLRGSVAADVCIVGGGYTGLSALLHLAERGYDAVLLEAARVGAGASGRNGGQLFSGFHPGPTTLERQVRPRARARALAARRGGQGDRQDADRAPSHRLRPQARRPGSRLQARPRGGAAARRRASRAPLRLPARPLPGARRDRGDARHRALFRRPARSGRRPSAPAELRARPGGRGGRRGRADLRAQPGHADRRGRAAGRRHRRRRGPRAPPRARDERPPRQARAAARRPDHADQQLHPRDRSARRGSARGP